MSWIIVSVDSNIQISSILLKCIWCSYVKWTGMKAEILFKLICDKNTLFSCVAQSWLIYSTYCKMFKSFGNFREKQIDDSICNISIEPIIVENF